MGIANYLCLLSASAAVTAVTGYSSNSPLFFERRAAAHDRFVQKIALTAINDQADNSIKKVAGAVATAAESRLRLQQANGP